MVILEKLKILTKITEALSSFSTHDEIFDFILSSVRAIYGVEYVAILMVDRGTHHLQIVRSCGYPEERLRNVKIKIGEGVTGKVVLRGNPVIVHDVFSDHDYVSGDDRVRSEMAVPLRVNNRVVGVLSVESTQEKYFSNDDLELFALFAAQVSAFICHFNLYSSMDATSKTLERKIEQLMNINAVAKNIVSTVSPDMIFNNILQSLRSVAPEADRFAFLMFDREEKCLIVKSAIGHCANIIDQIRVLPGQGITGSSFTMKQSLIVHDVSLDSRFLRFNLENVGSEMSLPLIVNGDTLGIIDIVSSKKHAFKSIEQDFMDTIVSFASVAIGNSLLFEDNKQAYFQTISCLAEALDARDSYTKGHSERVTRYALEIAGRMNIAGSDYEILKYASILHDIGKIGIVDDILHKKFKLTEEEYEVIKSHPSFGEKILKPVSFLKEIRQIVRHHHEKFDGTGYPEGLTGEKIPLLSRIISVADSFDAMTSSRPYRDTISFEDAVTELLQNRGTQFDPNIVDVFVDYWRGYGSSTTQIAQTADNCAGR